MKKGTKVILAIVLVLLVAVLGYIIYSSYTSGLGNVPEGSPLPEASPSPEISPSTPSPSPEDTPAPSPSEEPAPVLLGETEDMGQEYIDSFVFYGDSNTNGLRLNELLPGAYNTNQVWTPMSGTLTLNRWNIDKIVYPETWTEIDVTEAMSIKKPEYLLINLGMNGVSFMDEEYFTSTYSEMVDALSAASPETKIILSSMYPVADGYLGDDLSNAKIDTANQWIYGIAEEKGLRYLDVNSMLKCDEGDLPESLNEGNGFHLTKEGYQMVLDFIRTHGWK